MQYCNNCRILADCRDESNEKAGGGIMVTLQEYAEAYGSFYKGLSYRTSKAAHNHHCDICNQTIFVGHKYHALDLSPREFRHEATKGQKKKNSHYIFV